MKSWARTSGGMRRSLEAMGKAAQRFYLDATASA